MEPQPRIYVGIGGGVGTGGFLRRNAEEAMPNSNRPLTEPAMVVETFITGMLRPESTDGIVRLVFYTDRSMGTEEERVVMIRMIMERQVFLEITRDILGGIGTPV